MPKGMTKDGLWRLESLGIAMRLMPNGEFGAQISAPHMINLNDSRSGWSKIPTQLLHQISLQCIRLEGRVE